MDKFNNSKALQELETKIGKDSAELLKKINNSINFILDELDYSLIESLDFFQEVLCLDDSQIHLINAFIEEGSFDLDLYDSLFSTFDFIANLFWSLFENQNLSLDEISRVIDDDDPVLEKFLDERLKESYGNNFSIILRDQKIWMNAFNQTEINNIPSFVTTLNIDDDYPDIVSLRNLPPFLTDIRIDYASRFINDIKYFPENLKSLIIGDLHELKDFSEFPRGLIKLELVDFSKITNFETLPPNLKSLSIFEEIKAISSLPNNLVDLLLANTEIECLPKLPSTLKKLQIWESDTFRKLGDLPEGLETLEISSCKNLENLKGLPSTLEVLKIDEESLSNLGPDCLKIVEKYSK
jgi:hypothetical protein